MHVAHYIALGQMTESDKGHCVWMCLRAQQCICVSQTATDTVDIYLAEPTARLPGWINRETSEIENKSLRT